MDAQDNPDATVGGSATRLLRGSTFVGREAEVTSVDAFLDSVRRGRTSVLLVEAEAGGGKTSLLRHATRQTNIDQPFTVWASEGDPNDGRALRCLAEALDCRLSSADSSKRRIAELLRGASAQQVEGMTAAAQELMVDVIERRALDGPVVLVVDDLQWVDDASLAVIASLPRRLPGIGLGVLAATRPSARVDSALRLIAPQTLRLGPFDDSALAALAQRATGERPSDDDLAVFASVRSNPFLIGVLAQNRQSMSADDASGEVTFRPAEPRKAPVIQALGRMTAGLPRKLRDFLDVAAIAGRDVDVDLLSQALDLRVAAAVTMARDAVERGWLSAEDATVRFRHDLYSEALVAALPIDRRDTLHLLLGRTLASMGHAPGRAAFHLDASAYLLERSDLDAVLHVIEALPADDEVVATLAKRAVELDRTNGEAWCARLRSLAVRRQHAEVVRLASTWLNGVDDGDPVRFAIRLLAATSAAQATNNDDAIAILQAGLGLESLKGDQRADYFILLARFQWVGRDSVAVRASAGEALTVSRALGYVQGEVAALCVLSEAATMLGDPYEALRTAEEAVELAKRLRGPHPPTPELAYATALMTSGRVREGLPLLMRSVLAVERSSDSIALGLAYMSLHSGRFIIGDWDGYIADADSMVEVGRETGMRSAIVFPLSFAVMAACRRAEFDRALSIGARLRVEATLGDSNPAAVLGSFVGELAEIEAEGRYEDACAKAVWLAGVTAQAGFAVQSQVAMEASRLAWIAEVPDVQREMAEFMNVVAERATTPTRRAMAQLCAAFVDGGADALRSAAEALSSTERVWDIAVAYHAAGLAARIEGRSDAAELLSEAADRYDALGCSLHAIAARDGQGFRSVRELFDRGRTREAPTSKAPSNLATLSGAERRVLHLLTDGRANGDIAAELFVSKRTVESHVASLYKKLGVSTRVALAHIGSANLSAKAS